MEEREEGERYMKVQGGSAKGRNIKAPSAKDIRPTSQMVKEAIFDILGEKIKGYLDSPTNQQFPILTADQMAFLKGKVEFEVWERLADGRCVTRFATSWATTKDSVTALALLLAGMP